MAVTIAAALGQPLSWPRATSSELGVGAEPLLRRRGLKPSDALEGGDAVTVKVTNRHARPISSNCRRSRAARQTG